MEIRFGTDGWRGVIAREFTFDNVSLVAQAVMDYMKRDGLAEKGLVIGFDRRFLSREFSERVAEVACGNGIRVWLGDSHAPTPAVSWSVRELGAGGGVMITASHNPPIYNGFKFKEAFGGSARPATTKILEEIVRANLAVNRPVISMSIPEAVAGGLLQNIDMLSGYLHQLEKYVNLDIIRKAGIQVVADPMYGAGAGLLPILVPGTTEIHGEENPSFGGRPPEPTEENLSELSQLVKTGKYRVGLAFDGDADRIGAVDENGEFFSPQWIFVVLLQHFFMRKGLSGGVVKTAATTRLIDLMAEKYRLPLHEVLTGFKHVGELMLTEDILIAGEESGSLGVKGYIPERDGILIGLLLLETIAISGMGLRQQINKIINEFGPSLYHRLDLLADHHTRDHLYEQLRETNIESIASRKVAAIKIFDGFKYTMEDGSWLLIRTSGTEPMIRLYGEAADNNTLEELLLAGRKLARI